MLSINHFQLSVTANAHQIELLADIFFELGADAVTMTDAKDEPLFQLTPEDEPLWQQTTVHALFNSDLSPEKMIDAIKTQHPEFSAFDFYIEKIAEKNWVAETQKQFHAQSFGQLWIYPRWEKSLWEKSKHKKNPVVFIEPGLAFGTGTHPTTQLCLTWLATHDLKNSSVIDYGCGSGILALAALALGAKTVAATDHDPQALIATKNNEQYNAFRYPLIIQNTTDIQSARATIVIANILANPLIELAPILTKLLLPKGQLILSGILSNDADRVAAYYETHFTRTDTQHQDEWCLMVFKQIKST